MHICKEAVSLQCIILEVIFGIIELKRVGVHPGIDLEGQAKQPLQVFQLLDILFYVQMWIRGVKNLQRTLAE